MILMFWLWLQQQALADVAETARLADHHADGSQFEHLF